MQVLVLTCFKLLAEEAS